MLVLCGAAVAFTALAACSLGVDFDAYSKGGTDGGDIDAPTVEVDSGSDAPDPIPDAGFCANRDAYFVCDDFDGTFDAGWSELLFGDASIGTTDTFFVSPPRALLATRGKTTVPSETGIGAFLFKQVDPKLKNALVEADVRSCMPTAGFINHFAFYDDKSAVATGVAFNGAPKAFSFAALEGTFGTPFYALDPLPPHRFAHLRWTVRFDPAVGSLKLEVDGKVVIDAQNIATSLNTVSERALQVGVLSGQDNPECKVFIDNVTVTMTP